jgi:hypothetical protein
LSTNHYSDLSLPPERVGPPYTELNVISSKVQQGRLFHKFQLIRSHCATPHSRKTFLPSLTPAPSPSEQDRLAAALVGALGITAEGYRLQCLGVFISDLPSRIGHNPALDVAVACLLQCHSQLLYNAAISPHPAVAFLRDGQKLPSSEYMKALRTLQEVIEHPVLGTSTETVCATLLMSHYEVSYCGQGTCGYTDIKVFFFPR